jgi:hypothetical protein
VVSVARIDFFCAEQLNQGDLLVNLLKMKIKRGCSLGKGVEIAAVVLLVRITNPQKFWPQFKLH